MDLTPVYVERGSLVISIPKEIADTPDGKALKDVMTHLAQEWIANMGYIMDKKGEETTFVPAKGKQVYQLGGIAATIQYAK